MYAIIDIESTGRSPKRDKITEIAILHHDGERITDRFVTLINPQRQIPYLIQGMTGINNEMIEYSPKFYEVAKKIVEMTEDRILVGHNINFDYGFLRHEFLSLGFEFKRKKVDTVKLARQLLPHQLSYSLGPLCESLGIRLERRHRAEGDAEATAELFAHLQKLEEAKTKQIQSDPSLELGLFSDHHKEMIDQLPRETGVYYFFNGRNQLIYVGKSINIRDRVLSHFANNSSKKAVEMKNNIASIRYRITGSELVALLMESAEIKRHKPHYNRAQRRTEFKIGVFMRETETGYLELYFEKLNPDSPEPLSVFAGKKSARMYLDRLVDQHELCQKFTGLYKTRGSCFYHDIHRCHGACVGKEDPETYNERVRLAMQQLEYRVTNAFLLDQGRKDGECSLVLIEGGRYKGFGFAPEDAQDDPDRLREYILPKQDNRDIQAIINGHLRRHEMTILEF